MGGQFQGAERRGSSDGAGWGWFAGKGSHWGRGGGCGSIGVIRHRAVWMTSGEIQVFMDWAAARSPPPRLPWELVASA